MAPPNERIGFLRPVCCAFCIVTGIGLLSAGLSVAAEDSAEDSASQQKAAHLARMQKLAQSIRVFELYEGQRVETRLVDQPILAYRDDTRQQDESTMWIWGPRGRPSAIIAVEYYPQYPREKRWLYEIVSLSTARIAAEREPEFHWQAREPGLALAPLANAPRPADKASARLAQMRHLRRRFNAHEVEGTNGRVELQPLAAPLHRYQDPERGILDGAIFALANGTNPEVLWIIEAHSEKDSPATWKFGLAQMTGGEVFVELDGQQVWTRREANPPAERESYINGWLPAAEEANN